MEDLKIKALKSKYVSNRDNALATLELLLKNTNGAVPPSTVIDEMDRALRIINDSNSLMTTIDVIFVQAPPTVVDEELLKS